jgi:hypothetical protein
MLVIRGEIDDKRQRRSAVDVDSQVYVTAKRRIQYLARVKTSGPPDYFLGTTESFIDLPNRNFRVVFAGI